MDDEMTIGVPTSPGVVIVAQPDPRRAVDLERFVEEICSLLADRDDVQEVIVEEDDLGALRAVHELVRVFDSQARMLGKSVRLASSK